MAKTAYIFDTNMFSKLVRQDDPELKRRVQDNHESEFVLSEAVVFEVERGLLHREAASQLDYFREQVLPLFSVVPVTLADWRIASRLWAEMRRKGIQLSDIDFLIAAVTLRLDGILVSADDDFDALPIKRENWREA
jgi:predicted nucleic acid-binding protein